MEIQINEIESIPAYGVELPSASVYVASQVTRLDIAGETAYITTDELYRLLAEADAYVGKHQREKDIAEMRAFFDRYTDELKAEIDSDESTTTGDDIQLRSTDSASVDGLAAQEPAPAEPAELPEPAESGERN